MSEILKGLRRFEEDQRLSARINLLMSEWSLAYPHVNLQSQIQFAHAWLESNPRRCKKDNVRFLNNWMKNEEKRYLEGSRRAAALPPPPRYNIPEEDLVTADMFGPLKHELLRIKWQKRTE